MLNLRNESGRRVDVLVDADVASGVPSRRNDVVGIPFENALNGATVAFLQEGLVGITFSGQGTIGAGSYLYFDVSAGLLSLGAAAGDVEFGQVVGLDPESASRHLVKMNVGFPRAAAGNDQSSVGE